MPPSIDQTFNQTMTLLSNWKFYRGPRGSEQLRLAWYMKHADKGRSLLRTHRSVQFWDLPMVHLLRPIQSQSCNSTDFALPKSKWNF